MILKGHYSERGSICWDQICHRCAVVIVPTLDRQDPGKRMKGTRRSADFNLAALSNHLLDPTEPSTWSRSWPEPPAFEVRDRLVSALPARPRMDNTNECDTAIPFSRDHWDGRARFSLEGHLALG
jgi:hypothetical protein